MSGPCANWITTAELCKDCEGLTPDDDIAEDACEAASYVLYNFTRKKYPGVCSDVVRPCRLCSSPGSWAGRWWSYYGHVAPGSRWNPPPCGCSHMSEVILPGAPVVSISSVKVDGVTVDPSKYRVDDGNKLVRVDGHVWPSCQRMDPPDTEVGTFSVDYEYGNAPPQAGVRMAKLLACELASAFSKDKATRDRCQLPRRVTAITRQNVTMAILDPLSLFKDGQTGIAAVDMWVQADLFGDNQRGAAFIDPAKGRTVRRTG